MRRETRVLTRAVSPHVFIVWGSSFAAEKQHGYEFTQATVVQPGAERSV